MLLYQLHSTPRIRRPIVPVHIVRRARDDLSLIWASVRVGSDRKIRATAVVHPDTPTIGFPAVALLAGRVAALLHQLNSTLHIGWTIMPAAVIRGA
jgi:hypothetical protein